MTQKTSRLANGLLHALSILVALIFLFPILWAIFVSLKQEGTAITNAFEWFLPPYTLENYPKILSGTKVARWLFNSVFVAVVTTALILLLGSLAAFALAKIKFPFAKGLLVFFMIGLMVPTEATIIPLYIIAGNLGILDSYAGLIAPVVGGSMYIIILTSFMRSLPDELIEAAVIDGAGYFRIYRQLILPLSKSVLMTVGIFGFMASWNNYLWPFLSAMSENMFTLPVGIPTFVGQYSIDYVMPLTAAMVASIPAILAYLFLEKYITEGIALTGIKG